MKNDQLITQIETYSNAIVGFVVLQAIGYSTSFGTNELFNCLVKTAQFLAPLLTAHFFFVAVLACYAMRVLRQLSRRLSEENSEIVGRIYSAKCIAIVLFSLMPLTVTVFYGVRDYPSKFDCKQRLNLAFKSERLGAY